jgi:hypothetical protein
MFMDSRGRPRRANPSAARSCSRRLVRSRSRSRLAGSVARAAPGRAHSHH